MCMYMYMRIVRIVSVYQTSVSQQEYRRIPTSIYEDIKPTALARDGAAHHTPTLTHTSDVTMPPPRRAAAVVAAHPGGGAIAADDVTAVIRQPSVQGYELVNEHSALIRAAPRRPLPNPLHPAAGAYRVPTGRAPAAVTSLATATQPPASFEYTAVPPVRNRQVTSTPPVKTKTSPASVRPVASQQAAIAAVNPSAGSDVTPASPGYEQSACCERHMTTSTSTSSCAEQLPPSSPGYEQSACCSHNDTMAAVTNCTDGSAVYQDFLYMKHLPLNDREIAGGSRAKVWDDE